MLELVQAFNAALALGGALMMTLAGALALRANLRVSRARHLKRFIVMIEQHVACQCGARWNAVHPLAERLQCPNCGKFIRPPQAGLTCKQAKALVDIEASD